MKTTKQINSAIKSISKSGEKITATVHATACSVIGHILAYGDTTLADNLVAALGEGLRKQALVNWLCMFGPVTFETKTRTFKVSRVKKVAMLEEMPPNAWSDRLEALDPAIVDVDGASVTRWDAYTKQKVTTPPWDCTEYLDGVIKALKKHDAGEEVITAVQAARAKANTTKQIAELMAIED